MAGTIGGDAPAGGQNALPASADPDAQGPAGDPSDDDCGCRALGARQRSPGAWGYGLLLLLLLLGARRRGSSIHL